MKTRLTPSAACQGSVLVISLLVALITGFALASYLILTSTQNVSIARSQSWNSSLVLTEAGVEDGLAFVNRYVGDSDLLPTWTNNVGTEGWDNPSANVFHVQRNLPVCTPGGVWYTNSYEVWVTNENTNPMTPTIYACGTAPWNYLYAGTAPQPIFAAVGGDPTVAVNRQVFVKTTLDPLFVVAMAALDRIDLKGNNIATDSFDSGDPNYSNNGLYPIGDWSKTKANGDICTDSSLVDSLNVANANIKGTIKTGPGTNTISIGPNGSVGDRAWVEGGIKGIQQNPPHSATDFNVAFPPVTLPDAFSLALPVSPVNTNVDGVTYKYVIETGGYYYVNEVLTGNMLVTAPSNAVVRLLLKNNVNLSGSGDFIRLPDNGAKLRIWMQGSTFSMTGGAIIDNQSGHADNFYLYGLPTCTSIIFGGNASFYGGIYAPQADFYLGGGGSDVFDFVGSSVTKSVTMNGHFNFHYDENLAKVGPSLGYKPTKWKEM